MRRSLGGTFLQLCRERSTPEERRKDIPLAREPGSPLPGNADASGIAGAGEVCSMCRYSDGGSCIAGYGDKAGYIDDCGESGSGIAGCGVTAAALFLAMVDPVSPELASMQHQRVWRCVDLDGRALGS